MFPNFIHQLGACTHSAHGRYISVNWAHQSSLTRRLQPCPLRVNLQVVMGIFSKLQACFISSPLGRGSTNVTARLISLSLSVKNNKGSRTQPCAYMAASLSTLENQTFLPFILLTKRAVSRNGLKQVSYPSGQLPWKDKNRYKLVAACAVGFHCCHMELCDSRVRLWEKKTWGEETLPFTTRACEDSALMGFN